MYDLCTALVRLWCGFDTAYVWLNFEAFFVSHAIGFCEDNRFIS
jgi:hypothetical protein